MKSSAPNQIQYTEFPEDKYITYECFSDETNRLIFIENADYHNVKYFETAKSIKVSKCIPRCFHSLVLRYYFFYSN